VRGSCVSTATARELQLRAQHARGVVFLWEESAGSGYRRPLAAEYISLRGNLMHCNLDDSDLQAEQNVNEC